MKLSQLNPNSSNPRRISEAKLQKLKTSIESFEQMMEARPMIVNADMEILGGNMRYRALNALGYDEIPDNWVKQMDFTPEQEREFIIKDNVGFGEWDWDILANEWETQDLGDWGLDMPIFHDNLSNNDQYIGLNPEAELDSFMNAEIKRLYLAYDSETFAKVIEWLNKKLEETSLNNYSEYVLKLMENEAN
jgi:hypothetical protein